MRDAFFASPLLPRLLNPDSVSETIARGVENGLLAYVGKGKGDSYEPFHFKESLAPDDVEVSDEMFVITAEEAKKNIEPPRLTTLVVSPARSTMEPGKKQTFSVRGPGSARPGHRRGHGGLDRDGRGYRRGRGLPGRAGRGQLPDHGECRRGEGNGRRHHQQAWREAA